MASVSVISTTDFRANLSPQQNNAQDAEGGDPFSLLLNVVSDVNASAGAPDAPKAAERRDDVPAKQSKSDTDADRQTKRNTPEADKPEAKPQAEASAPVKDTNSDEDGEETDTDTDGDEQAAVDALLMIALTDPQQQTTFAAQASADANVAPAVAAVPAVAANIEATPEVQTAPALAAPITDITADASVEMQPAQAVQNTAPVKAQFEIAATPVHVEAETETEIVLPKISSEAISSLLKPLKTATHAEAQVQTQPGSVNVANATPLHGPAPLEMLNAAISKHVQLSLGLETAEVQPDAQKPLISSNAVAPNFAVTTQVNAPVQVQTQAVAEVSRAVPVQELAVEIATRAGKGERRFDIRLDPPELGRIDVRLEIDSKGNTTTKLIVERSETLDMLKQDARGLEKALQNAGLKLDAGGLEFSLRQDAQAQQGQQNHAPDMRPRPDLAEADTEIMTEIAAGNASLAAQIRGGVDIRI